MRETLVCCGLEHAGRGCVVVCVVCVVCVVFVVWCMCGVLPAGTHR